jgi:hypothetical protein
MPTADLVAIAERLRAAAAPEEVFGPLTGPPDAARARLKSAYRRLCKLAHPDRYAAAADRALATEAFAGLTAWLAAAESRLAHAAAPSAAELPVELRAGGRLYRVGALLAEGDLATLYRCAVPDTAPAVLKLARDPADNDLLANEAESLRALAVSPAAAGFRPYFPTLLDAFDVADTDGAGARRAVVMPLLDGFVSLSRLRAAFAAGLPPEHMGWIWRRLLTALTVAHRAGLVHGVVLPDHVLIHPTERGLVLVDWAYAVPRDAGRPIAAVSLAYERWYPAEVWRKEPPTPATDLFLAARCMVDLMGGDPLTGALPPAVPARIRCFLAGVARPQPRQRPQEAAELLAEFDDLLVALYGARRYVPLRLPGRDDHAPL